MYLQILIFTHFLILIITTYIIVKDEKNVIVYFLSVAEDITQQ